MPIHDPFGLPWRHVLLNVVTVLQYFFPRMGNVKFKLLKSEKIATPSTLQGHLQILCNSRNILETVDNSLLHRLTFTFVK